MKCEQCNEEKEIDEILKHKKICKKCLRKHMNETKKTNIKIKNELLGIDEGTKQCTGCKLIKNNDQFSKNRHKCKDCINIQDHARYLKNRHKKADKWKNLSPDKKKIIYVKKNKIKAAKRKLLLETTLKCKKCKQRKQFEHFIKIEDKYKEECIECLILYQIPIKEKINIILQNIKKCARCNLIKAVSEFPLKKKNEPGKYNPNCKICCREACKKFKAANKDIISKYNKKYKAANAKMITDYNRQWTANRKKTCPTYKIKSNLRIRLNILLKGTIKSATTEKLLGCSYEFLLEWLKFRFVEGMTEQNHGKVWQLDHVKPCASFDLSLKENQQKCFSWPNLQPLFAKDNIVKNDKILFDMIINHNEKVLEFSAIKQGETTESYNKLMRLRNKII